MRSSRLVLWFGIGGCLLPADGLVWTVEGTADGPGEGSDSAVDAPGGTDSGDDDTQDTSDLLDTEPPVALNQPPEITAIQISGAAPAYNTSVLGCLAMAMDPDGPPPTVSYEWRNDTRSLWLISDDEVALTPSTAQPGDVISCIARASDRFAWVSRTETVTLANREPVPGAISISPSVGVGVNTQLVCGFSVSDPDGTSLTRTYQWRNQTNGTTIGTSQTMTPVYSFASALVDLDGDGWQDLIVAGDYGTTQLFWNDGDGTFTEGTATAGVGFDGNAMGLAIGDVDGNGTQDLFITAISGQAETCFGRPCSIVDPGNRLFLNNGDRTFTDATDAAGVREGAWGWGAAAFDADNDGTLDLVMTNGIRFDADASLEAFAEPWAETPKRLWLNDGTGSFTEVAQAAGITTTLPGSGLAVFDLDGNGALDIIMVHPTRAPSLWRHAGTPDNAWLGVRVIGTDSNRDGLGAVVEVTARDGDRPQVRHIGANSHFLGQSTRTAYVGLGPAGDANDGTVAEVRVRFPATGRSVTLTDVPTGQVIDVVEPAS